MKATQVTLYIATMMLMLTCSSLPESFKTGKESLDKKDYAKAVTDLGSANEESPNSEEVEKLLAKAEHEYSKQLVSEEKELDEFDINTKIEKLDRASTELGSAIKLNEKAYQKKKEDGPGMFESMKKKMSSDYKTEAEVYADLLKSERKSKKTVDRRLSKLTSKKNKVIKDTDKIVNDSKKSPVKALKAYAPFMPYSQYWEELAAKEKLIKTGTVAHYEKQGFKQLRKNRYKKATANFTKGLEVIPGNEQSLSGILSVEAKRAYNKKDYRSAFDNINGALRTQPTSAFAIKFKKKTKKTLFKTEMRKARKLVKSSNIKKNTNAFAIYDFLASDVVEDDTKLANKVKQKQAALKTKIAQRLIAKAVKLHKKNPFKYSSTELQYYQLANIFDPKLASKHSKKASFALAVSNEKKRYNILVYDEKYKKKPDYTDANLTLSENLSKALKSSSTPGMKVITSDDLDRPNLKKSRILKEKSLPFKTAEVVIYNKIDKFDFKESGRDRPRKKSSRYISGKRWVSNPQYNIAYNNWQRAKQNYQNAYYQRQQALSACNELTNTYARSFCRGAVGSISASAKNRAYAKYQNTPRQIAKDVISSYRYTVRKVKLTGRAVAQVTLYDKRNKTKLPPETFEVVVSKEGHINEDVQPSDQNGIQPGDFNVPDIYVEKDMAKKELVNKVIAKISEKIDKHYYNRYCMAGAKLLKRKRKAQAAEAFSLCKNLASTAKVPESMPTASKAVDNYIGISPEEAFKYAKAPAPPQKKEEESTNRAPASAVIPEPEQKIGAWPATPAGLSKKSTRALNKFLSRP